MSKIEWTDRTWNMVTGCNKVSPGCRGCYAETMHKRLMGIASQKEKYFRPFNDGAFPYEPALEEPFLVKKPTMFFSPSMSDLFHPNVPLAYIAKVWAVMYLNPHHTFQVLTKRHERLQVIGSSAFHQLFIMHAQDLIKQYDFPKELFDVVGIGTFSYVLPLKNVWLGVSCEDDDRKHRIEALAQVRAAVHFVSCEPLIAPLTLPESFLKLPSAWVICGGESGHTARPMHPDWARSLRDQCKAAGVPFFFKQWGEWLPYEPTAQPPFYRNCANGIEHDGHGMNFTDIETDEPGKWGGGQWMDAMDSIIFCTETDSEQCSFLKVGKHKTGNLLDGVQHLEYPKAARV